MTNITILDRQKQHIETVYIKERGQKNQKLRNLIDYVVIDQNLKFTQIVNLIGIMEKPLGITYRKQIKFHALIYGKKLLFLVQKVSEFTLLRRSLKTK